MTLLEYLILSLKGIYYLGNELVKLDRNDSGELILGLIGTTRMSLFDGSTHVSPIRLM